jgi:hypothetical protein
VTVLKQKVSYIRNGAPSMETGKPQAKIRLNVKFCEESQIMYLFGTATKRSITQRICHLT